MSTINDVRAAKNKVPAILEALRKAGAQDPENLTQNPPGVTKIVADRVLASEFGAELKTP